MKTLRKWEETIGTLNKVMSEKGQLVLLLKDTQKIRMNSNQKLIKEKLQGMIGQKIAILRTDPKDNPFLIMDVEAYL